MPDLNAQASLAALALLLVAASPVSAQVAPAAPAQPQAPMDTSVGEIHLVVFASDNSAYAGVTAQAVPAGVSATTGSDGSVLFAVPIGEHELRLTPPGGAAQALPNVRVVSAETTEVIATFLPDGTLQADVTAPEQTAAAPTPEQIEAASKPPGRIEGRLTSAEGGAPVASARIFVAGQASDALSDDNGQFTVSVSEGKHLLSIIHPKFSTETIKDVAVQSDKTTPLNVELTPAAAELEDFVITAPRIKGGVDSVLNERRQTAAVTDAIGAEDIARMPASNAADAAQRVVGATIVGGRFVYVRGLGERYSNALLNGAPLPSPEPDRATVPLDLFPAQVLESLDVSKTFTPDVPGDFAGGSVRIVTRSVPEEPLAAASLSVGLNSESSFKKVYGQESSSTDFLGFDDGTRALASEVPRDHSVLLVDASGDRISDEDRQRWGLAMNSKMTPTRETNLPNVSGSLAFGDGWDVGEEQRVGVLASLVYGRKFEYDETPRRVFQASTDEETGIRPWTEYARTESATDAVRWGAFGSTVFELSKEHRLSLLGMRSQLADATTEVLYSGYSRNVDANFAPTRLEFVSRALTFGQLQGDHEFPVLNEAKLDWIVSIATAQRDQPDTRDVVYQQADSGEWFFLNGVESGRHFFADQSENSKTAGLDWMQSVVDGDFGLTLKTGGLVTLKDRTFRSRRFAFEEQRGADLPTCEVYHPIDCADDLFLDENIGPLLAVREGTMGTDSYNAALDVYAAYGMAEIALGEQWRLLGGVRAERTEQLIEPFDQFTGEASDDESERSEIEQTDLLPAGAIVFSPWPDFSIRAAVSRTLARPQLRETAPFAFSNFFGGPQLSGYPDLKLTSILNGDLRFEYFPSPREVLALSVFAKDFTDPIEPVYLPSESITQSYRNAKGAQLYGVEVEARKSLDFMDEALENFTLITSLMLADSQIRIVQTGDEDFLTNLERRLVHQAPYVVNLSIDYENEHRTQLRVLYNLVGPRVIEIGTNGLDDAYEHPRHVLDLTASQGLGEHFKLKLNVENLLNAEHLVTQGQQERPYNIRERFLEGISASIGLSYSH